MTLKTWIVAGLILGLGGLNVYRYWDADAPQADGATAQSVSQMPLALPELHVFPKPLGDARETPRDLFEIVEKTTPDQVVSRPEPIAPDTPPAPDPTEVALEAARVNLRNVRVTGILSSKSGLSAMVDAPFFNGTAIAGADLGEGLRLEVVGLSEVRISHPELNLVRDIVVE